MSSEKQLECILVYSALDIGASKKKYFRSHNIHFAPLCASEVVLLDIIFDSKRGAAGDNISSGHYNLSSPTVNLTLNGSGFIGQ